MSDIDTSGIHALEELLVYLKKHDIQVSNGLYLYVYILLIMREMQRMAKNACMHVLYFLSCFSQILGWK